MGLGEERLRGYKIAAFQQPEGNQELEARHFTEVHGK